MLKNLKLWDGHTHSEFCPHGSKEKTAAMVEKAIQLGFTRYSITEHAPLPLEFLKKKGIPQNSSLAWEDLEAYWEHIEILKETYHDKIEILSGLEMDYLLSYEDFTQEFLTKNSACLDEVIFSLHYLPDKNGDLKIIDKSWEFFQKDFLPQNKEVIWEGYWKGVEKMVSKKWTFDKPIRIGHLALIEKYNLLLQPTKALRKKWQEFILQKILPIIAEQGYSLDFNVAGLRKKDCRRLYLYPELLEMCKKLNIPLVYGSDSHSVKEVGFDYKIYAKTIENQDYYIG